MSIKLHCIICLFTLLSSISLQGQTTQSTWEISPHHQYDSYFQQAYQLYPSIPKGILEAIAYTNTHIRHVQPKAEHPSCMQLPDRYGVMGLILDPQQYFKSSLLTVAQYSDYSTNQIQQDPKSNILAFAQAYHQLQQLYNLQSSAPEDHHIIIDALSEFPNTEQKIHNFAFDSHLYSIFNNLNHPKFQQAYQLPTYAIDLEKFFGPNRYAVVSASQLSISPQSIQTSHGIAYQNNLSRSMPPPCSDISGGFPHTVIQDAADPSNYSSRSGQAITHVTIHTMQGSYASAISWFKNPIANVSAHYNIRAADGQITQMVCEIDKAWHVSNSNPYAVGIEHEGYIDDPSWYTNTMYVVSADLTKDIAARYGMQLPRTYSTNGDNGLNPISDNCYKVKGHQHFPSQTHVDPGEFWDWNRYYNLINPVATANSNTYTTSSGTFFDSGGAGGNYANDERTLYYIQPTNATSVTLNFSSLDLEANYDYLYIYDGDSPEDPLLTILNGTSIPAPITGNSGQLCLEFRTDCATTRTGWQANWTSSTTPLSCSNPNNLSVSNQTTNSALLQWDAVSNAISYEITVQNSIGNLGSTIYYSNNNSLLLSGLASQGQYLWSVRTICGVGDTSIASGSSFIQELTSTNETVTACTGTFTDNGGLLGKYARNEDYTFTISPSNASSVSLSFSSFDLESNYDYMYIHDGNSTSAPLIGTYTGNSLPPTINSTGNSLTIRFTSDGATQNEGWVATWSCTSSLPTYSNVILLDSSLTGQLNCGIAYHEYYDSGNSGGFYDNNEQYTQTFCNPDPTKAVRISFRPHITPTQHLSLGSNEEGNDYLYFYNGADINANLIGVYTGATNSAPQPGTFVSSGQCLTVQMESNDSLIRSGWIARLYCADPPNNLGTINVGGSAGNQTFTDLGGLAANYNNNESYTVTYCPHASAPAGEVVWASFNSNTGIEQNWDYLYVFDGSNTDQSRLIGIYTGNNSNQNTLETIKASIENSSGCLTFQFFSDGGTTASGWEATMSTGIPRLAFGADDCAKATFIGQTGRDYAGSTTIATGTPSTSDPSLNISVASLPECSGSNTITRLENTVWYRFITPDTLCIPTSMHLRINNISCQGEGLNGSGVQFVLYETNNCATGAAWGSPIYCADKLNSGDSINVANLLQPNQNYYIMIDGFTGQHCNFDLRFDVVTNGDPNTCLLPLELLSFKGAAQQQSNHLMWETAHEDNVFGFYIERAVGDELNFEEIGFVASAPTNTLQGALYTFDDYNYWKNKIHYYRLRQVDNDGQYTYSPTISIRRDEPTTLPLVVYPNPASNSINFSLSDDKARAYTIIIYDMTGKLLYQQSGTTTTGQWTEKLNIQELPSGMYAYKIQMDVYNIVGKFEKL